MRTLGLDVGTKTIGIALSDPLGMLAHPLKTLARGGVRKDTEALMALLQEHDIGRVVVGLPYELDGSEARSARLARQIGQSVATAFDVPLVYIDERYTSVDAERRLIQARVRRDRRKAIIDQAAAVLILQSFLDHPDLAESPRG